MTNYWYKLQTVWQTEGVKGVISRAWRKFLSLTHSAQRPAPVATFVSPLATPQPLQLQITWDATVSVLIYSRADKLFNCLYYVQACLAAHHSIEVMVLLDGTPPPSELLTVGGVQWLYSPYPLGAVQAWNYLAKKARGQYLLFLDDRCQVTPNYLDRLLPFLERGYGVGAKVISEHTHLLSAGVIMAETPVYFGDRDYPGEPCYNYVRPAEALVPWGFAIRASLFWQVGGLGEKFCCPVYAFADLCYRLAAANIPAIYQPKSQLVYRSAQLPGVDNADRLLWQSLWGTPSPPFHSRKAIKQPTILVIDTLVPPYDKESGAFRLHQILLLLLQQGYSVIFLPDYGHEQEPYTSELESLGIEVLYFTYQQYDWAKRLQQRLNYIDVAWVCRPELAAKYFPLLQQNRHIKLIYDTIDLHFLRLQREAELQGKDDREWQQMQQLEVKCAQQADVTIVVTAKERQILQQLVSDGAINIKVIPNIHPIYSGEIPDIVQRKGLLFIGGYYHAPNVDGVIWLATEIMPIIWAKRPDITVTLLGSNPPASVQALAQDPRLTVPGYVPDVSSYFLSHRLFVAPLRYGAGMKGKIGHSLSFGLPVVTTTIGAEGMGLEAGKNVLIADTPPEFAATVLDLYDDPDRWRSLSRAGYDFIRQYTPEAIAPLIGETLRELLSSRSICLDTP